MEIGKLEIQLLADVARLRTDMNNAQKVVGDSMKGIENAVGVAKKAFGAFAAVAGIGSFGSWIKGAIDAGDQALKLSQKLGVSTKDVAGLQLAFQLAGVSSEGMEKGLVKLSVQVANGSKTLQAFGIATKNADGSVRSTSSVLKDVADKFAGMQDGAQKTALAVQLFGKAGAEMIPLLNAGSKGLAEMDEMARKLGLQIDEKTARAAEQFNDTLDLMGMAVKGVARQAVAEIMPALTNMAAGFLNSMTEGDRLKNVSQLLGVVLKSLFTAVIVVIDGLSNLTIIAKATWQAFQAAADGEFSKAIDIIKQGGQDVAAGWKDTAEVVKKAWSNQADASLTATATMVGAQRQNADAAAAAALAAEENAKAVKKQADEFNKLTDTLDKNILTAKAQVDAGGKLTDAAKLELDVRAKLNDQTLKLTAAQRQEIEAKLASAKAALDDRDAQKATDDARKKLTETIGKQNEDLVKQIDAQRKANEEAGLTTEQIGQLEVQRLRDAAATAEQNAQLRIQSGINDEVTAEYQKQAENLRKLAEEKEKGTHIKAAQESAAEWKKTTDSIYDGLTDALMRAFESGKGFIDAFKSTLKNAFRTLILEPTIRGIMAPISGAIGSVMGSLVPGAAGASTGSSGGGAIGNIGGLAGMVGGLGGMAGAGLGYGLAAWGGSATLAGTLSGAGAMLTAGTVGSAVAGLAAIAGMAAPLVAAAVVLKKAFGMGPKRTTATGIEGEIGGGDVTAQNFSDWKKKGGWLRRDKTGTDYSAMSSDMAAALDQTAAAVYDQVRGYAGALGLSADALKGVTTRIRIQLGDDEAANEAAIAAAFESYRNALAEKLGPALEPFRKAGEELFDTLERLATLQAFSATINEFGGIFSRVSLLSVDAKEQLIGFAGGIEAFIQKTQAFVEAYYSADEKFGMGARQILDRLKALGIDGSSIDSLVDVRNLVESVDVSTEEGRKQLAALLDIANSFAPVGKFMAEQGKTLGQLAEAAPQVAVLESILGTQDEVAVANDRIATGVEQLNATMNWLGEYLAGRLDIGFADLLAGITSVATSSAQTARMLDRMSDGDALVTTTVP